MSVALVGTKGFQRIEKIRAGKTIEQIACEEGVSIETVESTVREFRARQLLEARARLERKNNQLRQRVQRGLDDKYMEALRKLLEGKKEVVLVIEGQAVPVTVTDPRALALGLAEYRRTVAMEEKPAPAPTMVVNVQQNNNGLPVERFEERLNRIRKEMRGQQNGIEPPGRPFSPAAVIDVESAPPADEGAIANGEHVEPSSEPESGSTEVKESSKWEF